MPSTVAFSTLGCRLNQAESDLMAEELTARGWLQVRRTDEAELIVVNTCTVTREATKASRMAIRRAVRSNPEARVVAIGCYAVSNPEEIEALGGVDAILTNDDKECFVEALRARPATAPLLEIGFKGAHPKHSAAKVRANLKVQTGCDEWCAFCIIPKTRGPLRSMDEASIVGEARARVAAGARELVITGVHIGKYGYDRGEDEHALPRLLRRLLEVDGVRRIRLSSILSRHLSDELLELIASEERLCRYLHVPLQSGDDGVLEAMNRPYRIDGYVASVERARRAIDGVALATDIIVGFPGESEAAFGHTMKVVRALKFSKLHVFRYSARAGTASAEREDDTSPEVKKDRSKRLIALGNEIRARYLAEHLHTPLRVLVEDERVVDQTGVCSGQTDDYVRVWFEGREHLGDVVEVEGARLRADGIEGRLVNSGQVELVSSRSPR